MRRLLALGMFLMTACSGGEPGPDTEAAGETSSASGLTITHITEGSGARPTATDVVRVHYHGTFPNGKVFDSSVERGKPASFPLNRVIPCWTEGLQQMQVGGKAKLVCPPEHCLWSARRPAPDSAERHAPLRGRAARDRVADAAPPRTPGKLVGGAVITRLLTARRDDARPSALADPLIREPSAPLCSARALRLRILRRRNPGTPLASQGFQPCDTS